MAQRLVRTLCPHCRQPGELSEDAWRDLVKPWKASKPKEVFEPVGCLECRNTGYLGRMGIYEMFTFTPELRALLTDNCDLAEIRKQAVKDGLRPLRLSGASKVASGVTTIEEVMRVAPPPISS